MNKVDLSIYNDLEMYKTEYMKRNPNAEGDYDDFITLATSISDSSVDGDLPLACITKITKEETNIFRKYGFVTLNDLALKYPSLILVEDMQEHVGAYSDIGLLNILQDLTIDSESSLLSSMNNTETTTDEDSYEFCLQVWKDETLDDESLVRLKRQYTDAKRIPVDKIGLPTYIYTDLIDVKLKTIGDLLDIAKDENYFREYELEDIKYAMGTKRMSAAMIKRLILSTTRIADGNKDLYVFRGVEEES